jgi:hypothetical protein
MDLGGLGAKIVAQFIAGGISHHQDVMHDVEIEILEPLLILRGVDHANTRIYAQKFEVFDEGLCVALEHAREIEELELQRLPVRQSQHAVFSSAAGSSEKVGGVFQEFAVLA